MNGSIRVLSITPIDYHRRIVRLLDEETGKQREILYGSSYPDRVIRRWAPTLWRKAKPIKHREED
ncbi:hypothetical protein [Paenibacillus odorifer]|uniref:hypothetical protein n=1 Tax=Paenibacillus odorifer TaxID=189426 RepID=UPI000BA14E6B|nr:hypothetical protein [Paenibacillus odorifer]OZQ66549.1 hypothetical protein CA596_27390 [Paenibacillus odorifer]